MSTLPRMRRLFRLDRGAQDVERAVTDELEFHFELTVRELVARGMTDAEARSEADRRFGDVDRVRKGLQAIDRARVRQSERTEWLQNLLLDARYALRGLRRRPGFTAAVVLILALGIGANATMFDIIDRLLFRPPAFLVRANDVHRVYMGNTSRGKETFSTGTSYRRFRELTDSLASIDAAAAFWTIPMAIGIDEPREQRVTMVSAGFWNFFKAAPVLGRYFSRNDEHATLPNAVVVLGFHYWQTAFAGRHDVLGTQLRIGRLDYTIIGVAPESFAGVSPQPPIAFVPLLSGALNVFGAPSPTNRWTDSHNMNWLEILVREKPEVEATRLNADLTGAFVRSWSTQRTERPQDVRPVAEARPRVMVGSVLKQRGPNRSTDARVAIWLVGVAMLVLIIACANVGNLLLARALQRRREIAVRLALGISRSRLTGQLLTESVLLALLGGAAGLLVAAFGGRVLRATLLPGVSAGFVGTLADSRNLLFTCVVALATGMVAGLAPVLYAARYDISASLKSGSREGSWQRSRTRSAMLVTQGALSVVLLIGAGLFVRSFQGVRSTRLGYDPEHLMYVELAMRGVTLDSAQRMLMMDNLLRAAKSIPGVSSAAQAVSVPFYFDWSEALFVEGIDSTRALGRFLTQTVSPEYFATLGTRILRGRGITVDDRKGAPRAIVVSASMAQTLWPGKEALGQCVRIQADTMPCTYVVGIAEDTKRSSFSDDPGLQYYLSREQFASTREGLFIRTADLATGNVARIRSTLQRFMPQPSYVTPIPFETILGPERRSWQLGATMFTLFGLLALFVAGTGLYGVIAFTVTQRAQEMGVRVALGASTKHVLHLVLLETVSIALLAVTLGSAAALLLSSKVQPLLFKTSSHDPLVYSLVAVTLLTVAIGAGLRPALRASRVNPSIALRAE